MITTTIAGGRDVGRAVVDVEGRVPATARTAPEKAASPTMPLSTPIEVMPICTDGEELGRVVVQVHRGLRTGVAGFHHHLQPRLAAGGERHLRHGEQAR